jgi:hypothetical protein
MDIQDTIILEGESKSIPERNIIPKIKKHKKNPHYHKKQHGDAPQIKSSILSKDSIQAIKDSKKINKPKKDLKPVEVIDKDKFNSLKAIFEKKEDKSKTEENKPNRLRFDQLSNFTNKENINTNDNSQDKPAQGQGGLSEGIKKRMENLFSSNKNTKKPSGYVDPVLENIKVRVSSERYLDEEYFDEEDFDEDVVLSENSSLGSEEDEEFDNQNLNNGENDLHKEENQKKNNQFEENVKDENALINKVPTIEIDENEPIFQKNPNLFSHKNENKITEDSDEFNI